MKAVAGAILLLVFSIYAVLIALGKKGSSDPTILGLSGIVFAILLYLLFLCEG